MPKYHIQHKIRVLLSNDANIGASGTEEPHSFVAEQVTFRPWSKDPREYWRAGEWLAECDIEAANLSDTLVGYSRKMSRVVPRISFVGQAYINDRMGPIFIMREDRDVGWFKSIISQEPVGLGFMDEEKEALESLLNDQLIPDTFYYYWNDAVNTTSYTGKLLLMFGAIDSLATRGKRRRKRNEILGEELANEIYADDVGLRNRLTHGEYLTGTEGKNYVETIHKKILEYFNAQIIGKDILELEIVNPQRHFEGNYASGQFYVRQENDNFQLDIHSLVADIENNEGIPHSYEIISDENDVRNY